MSGPGPSTSGMSRPGPSSYVIHPNTSYFVGYADCSDDSEEENNNIDNDSLPVDKVALDQNEGNDDDSHDFSESDDDMVNSDDNDDDNENMKKKRPRKIKWDERQELKWEHLTKTCLYEAAKDDMANGDFISISIH